MLEKASKLFERVFLARVPMMIFPLKTSTTPAISPEEATVRASRRFCLLSVVSKPMGFWAPVRTMGLGLPWMR